MAIYVYSCDVCDVAFELKRPMAEADRPADCPDCGGQCERRPALFGFVRGGGKPDPKQALDAAKTRKPHSAGCPCCAPRRPPKPAASTDVA